MYTRGIVTWHSWNWRNVLHLYTAVAVTLGEPQKHLEDLLKQTARPRPQRSWPSGSQRGLGSWHLFPRWRCCCWLGELSTPAEVMPRCAANSPSRLRHSECRCWPLSVSSPQKLPLLAQGSCLSQAYHPLCGAPHRPTSNTGVVCKWNRIKKTKKQLHEETSADVRVRCTWKRAEFWENSLSCSRAQSHAASKSLPGRILIV